MQSDNDTSLLPTDLTRVALMTVLSSGPMPVSRVKKSMGAISSSKLAQTIASAAKEGLVELNDHSLSLTPFGQRVLKSF